MSVYDIDYFKMFRYNAIRKIRGENMALSDNSRKCIDNYNKTKTTQVSIRLINKEYELFEKYCKEHNISKSGLLRSRILDIIKPEE